MTIRREVSSATVVNKVTNAIGNDRYEVEVFLQSNGRDPDFLVLSLNRAALKALAAALIGAL